MPVRGPVIVRAAAVALAAAATACMPPPFTASEHYVERSETRRDPPAAPLACRVAMESPVDSRRDRRTLGNVAGKTVFAPADSAAWLHNVLAGLATRGVAVQFLAAGEPAPPGLAGRTELIIAWVTNIRGNKSANVVMRVAVRRDAATVLEREYRGAVAGMNWASGDGEIQRMIDTAFGRLLDDMAPDLLALCAPGA